MRPCGPPQAPLDGHAFKPIVNVCRTIISITTRTMQVHTLSGLGGDVDKTRRGSERAPRVNWVTVRRVGRSHARSLQSRKLQSLWRAAGRATRRRRTTVTGSSSRPRGSRP